MMLQNQVTAKVRRRTMRIYGPVIVRLYYGNDGFRDECFDSVRQGLEFGKLWSMVDPYYRSFEFIQAFYTDGESYVQSEM